MKDNKSRVIYATDIDRTLIFSPKFLEEFPSDREKVVVETGEDGKVYSYMDKEAYDMLQELRKNPNVLFVPVTSRSVAEYERINFGFIPEYAIMTNGGLMYADGREMLAYNIHTEHDMPYMEAAYIMHDMGDLLDGIIEPIKTVDNRYLRTRTNDKKKFDELIGIIQENYPRWEIIRQNFKVYITPKDYTKQVALRWLWNFTGRGKVVVSGDGEVDIAMLTLGDRAVVPEHSRLFTEGYIESATTASGGISSPLVTMKIVKELADKLSENSGV